MTTAYHATPENARRIQRKRVKGWRLPAGAVCVTRPGKWGNPWTHDGTDAGRVNAWKLFEHHIKDRRDPWSGWVDLIGYPSDKEIRAELAGRDLACWCPVGSPCHGDVLLAIATQGHGGTSVRKQGQSDAASRQPASAAGGGRWAR